MFVDDFFISGEIISEKCEFISIIIKKGAICKKERYNLNLS